MAKKYIDQQQIDVDASGYVSVNIKGQTGGGLTDTELRATAVPVSLASVPLPTDAATQTTLALIKAKTDNIPALGQALAAASVPIVLTAAQETALTPPAAITGFATSAKQDTLLTELQLKADLTETQPVSLSTVPSHAVTNAGTFAVQNDAATPAGTNAIGKLLQPDIDVTTNTNYAKKYYTSAGAVTDGIIWSPAAGKRWHIHAIYINVSAAATVTLEDDLTAGDSAIWKGELAANSGVVLTFPEKYPWASSEDASDLLVTTNAGNIYITCSGFEI